MFNSIFIQQVRVHFYHTYEESLSFTGISSLYFDLNFTYIKIGRVFPFCFEMSFINMTFFILYKTCLKLNFLISFSRFLFFTFVIYCFVQNKNVIFIKLILKQKGKNPSYFNVCQNSSQSTNWKYQ